MHKYESKKIQNPWNNDETKTMVNASSIHEEFELKTMI